MSAARLDFISHVFDYPRHIPWSLENLKESPLWQMVSYTQTRADRESIVIDDDGAAAHGGAGVALAAVASSSSSSSGGAASGASSSSSGGAAGSAPVLVPSVAPVAGHGPGDAHVEPGMDPADKPPSTMAASHLALKEGKEDAGSSLEFCCLVLASSRKYKVVAGMAFLSSPVWSDFGTRNHDDHTIEDSLGNNISLACGAQYTVCSDVFQRLVDPHLPIFWA